MFPDDPLPGRADDPERSRQVVEERLRLSEQRHRLALEGAGLATFSRLLPAGRMDWNPELKRIFGLDPEEEVNYEKFLSRVHPEDREPTRRNIEGAQRDGTLYDQEYRIVIPPADASQTPVIRWVHAIGRGYRDERTGELTRFDGVAMDITTRRRAAEEAAERERRLDESEERFRALADNIAQLAWMADGTGAVFWYNRRWFDYTGITFEEMQGWGRRRIHHPDHVEQVRAKFLDHIARGEPWEDTFPIRRADGVYRWFLARAVPIRDAGGGVVRWFGTHTDIHEQREAEAAARHAQEQAEVANRLKDEFLAILSHELRTPLNAILGWAQMMRVEPDDLETRNTAIEIIERNTRAQVQLIEDLLDVSRITSGKMRLDVRPVDLETVVRAALESLRPAAEAKGLRLDAVLDPRAGPVSGDPDRLQQVVWNLLSNALKFTPKGGRVQVRLARVASSAQITVADNGQGLEPEFLPHLFERFRQADSSSRRSHSGLGIGLALVRHLVELHGGTVAAASGGPGQGATFTVNLPVALAHAAAPPALTAPVAPSVAVRAIAATADPNPARPRPLEGLRVLAVDDDADARSLLRMVLGRAGAAVTVSQDAVAGLAAVVRERPDVMLCDIEMPGEDGYELIAKVRTLAAAEGGTVPAVAVTAYARPEDRRRALAAGFQRHLSKPVEPEELILVVAGLTGRRPGATL